MFFFAPSDQQINWNEDGVMSQKKWLVKVFDLVNNQADAIRSAGSDIDLNALSAGVAAVYRKAHQVLERATQAYSDDLAINTLIARCHEWLKLFEKDGALEGRSDADAAALAESYRILIQVLAPIAPHLAEELWERIGNAPSIFNSPWPAFNPEAAKEDAVEIVIQFNGKVKHKMTVSAELDAPGLQEFVLADTEVQSLLDGGEPKKVIAVPGRLVNLVM
jgi:leucyl-tRNA synthetase